MVKKSSHSKIKQRFLEISNLSVSTDNKEILHDLNLTVKQGEFNPISSIGQKGMPDDGNQESFGSLNDFGSFCGGSIAKIPSVVSRTKGEK